MGEARPGDIVHRQKWRHGQGRRRCAGEGADLSTEMGLVGIAGFGRDEGGPISGGKAMSRMIKTDQLGCPLWCESDLGPEGGPQSFATPADLGRELFDPSPALSGHQLSPAEGDLWLNRSSPVKAMGDGGLSNHEAVLPGVRRLELILEPYGIRSPKIIKVQDLSAEFGRDSQNCVRNQRR